MKNIKHFAFILFLSSCGSGSESQLKNLRDSLNQVKIESEFKNLKDSVSNINEERIERTKEMEAMEARAKEIQDSITKTLR